MHVFHLPSLSGSPQFCFCSEIYEAARFMFSPFPVGCEDGGRDRSGKKAPERRADALLVFVRITVFSCLLKMVN